MIAANSASLAQRDLLLLLGALGGLVALCWWYLIDTSHGMAGMSGGMGIRHWSSIDFLLMFAMWAVMMVGMMVPTAIRSVLIFVQIGTRASARGRAWVSGYWFTAGYVLIWTLFGAAATLLQWALDQAALLSPMMVSISPILGGALLLAAGIFQLSPIKYACLANCRTPIGFLMTEWREGPPLNVSP